MANTLASAVDGLEHLLGSFLASILRMTQARAGAMRVLSDDGENLQLLAQHGLPPEVIACERQVTRQCGVCGVALSGRRPVWLNDASSCDRSGSVRYFGTECQRVLAVPLTHGDHLLGVTSLFFERDAHVDDAGLLMLSQIGQLVGLALYNARLEDERMHLRIARERRELVDEVHDAIAQTLAYAKMRLPLLHDAMLAHDDGRSLKLYGDVRQALAQAHDSLREVMTFFRARMDPRGLVQALRGIAEGFEERHGVVLHFDSCETSLGLGDQREIQVFHVVREALSNIAKHAQARQAWLRIQSAQTDWVFVIEDDGMGLSTDTAGCGAAKSNHFGLDIMQARAKRLGGQVAWSRTPGGGTRVELSVPMADAGR